MTRRFAFGLLLALCLCPAGASAVPYTVMELRQMTNDSLVADWSANQAFVRGVGRIAGAPPQGRLLARRAALTDARRGLLLLREELLSEPTSRWRARSLPVRGYVPSVRVLDERMEDGLYFVEVAAPLSALLNKNGRAWLDGGMKKLHLR